MLTGALIVQANREAMERCRQAASKAREPVRCTVRVGPDKGQ